MRTTWLTESYLSQQFKLKVKILFFTGLSKDASANELLLAESVIHKDIVQSSFEDDYMYNTYKAMSFLL